MPSSTAGAGSGSGSGAVGAAGGGGGGGGGGASSSASGSGSGSAGGSTSATYAAGNNPLRVPSALLPNHQSVSSCTMPTICSPSARESSLSSAAYQMTLVTLDYGPSSRRFGAGHEL